MLHSNLFQIPSQNIPTPPSPMKSRPLPSPSLESLEEFCLSELHLPREQSRKDSSLSQKYDKSILVIEFLEEKLRDYI